MTNPKRAARLVRKIRREEERAARQRAEASLIRSKLVRELVIETGSQQAAGDHLGTSRQAVSKIQQEAEKAWEELRRKAPALTYTTMRWPEYATDVPREEEWQELDGDEAAEAAAAARQAWRTLAYTMTQLRYMIHNMRGDLTGLLNEDNPQEELEAVLEEWGKGNTALRQFGYGSLVNGPMPRAADEIEPIRNILDGIESGLRLAQAEALDQCDVWAERVKDGEQAASK
ncbi:hypothetical protein ACFWMG_04750 [Streptomyces sp. NPDC127074]|uniref:hypothetical protein n=1 Tax=Streptomyces sp. NPDC127074 TaxID=3347130 RepID=UPI0036513D1D